MYQIIYRLLHYKITPRITFPTFLQSHFFKEYKFFVFTPWSFKHIYLYIQSINAYKNTDFIKFEIERTYFEEK